jgi:calcineurin-like phosphoesterase family protein
MKRMPIGFFLALLLAAIPTSTFGQMPQLKPLKSTPPPAAPKNPDQFTFILAGDNRPAKSTDPQPEAVQMIFKDVKQQAPAFVLWTGDIISGKDPSVPKTISKQYKEFLAIAASGNAAVFNAPGNHEMNDSNNCPNSTLLSLYLKDTAQTNPYGSFDYGNSHFIALDSDEPAPSGDPCNCSSQPSGDKPPGYISAAQLSLLSQDLEANKTKAHIFIILHRPLVGYKGEDQLCPSSTTQMQTLFKNYPNVSYVVAGHQHMYYNPQGPNEFGPPPARTDPAPAPSYLVSGGAGAPLKKKGFYHYLVFTIDGPTVTVQLNPVDAGPDVN